MDELLKLRDACHACRRCSLGGMLSDGKLANVFSNMNEAARILVVGQNPGQTEVEQGLPFVGPSGAFFDQAVREVLGWERTAFYVCNSVRCLSPGNRRPTEVELDACRPHLDAEVALLKPLAIVTLGGVALAQVTGLQHVSKRAGTICASPRYGLPVLVLLHPSPLNMNDPAKRAQFYAGLAKLKELAPHG